MRGIHDQHPGTDVPQHHGGLAVGVGRVQRHEGHPEPAQCKVQPDAFEGRLRPPGHALAPARPERVQRVGESIGQDVHLAKGQPLITEGHRQTRRRSPRSTGEHVIGDKRHCYSPLEDGVWSGAPSRAVKACHAHKAANFGSMLGYRAPRRRAATGKRQGGDTWGD